MYVVILTDLTFTVYMLKIYIDYDRMGISISYGALRTKVLNSVPY